MTQIYVNPYCLHRPAEDTKNLFCIVEPLQVHLFPEEISNCAVKIQVFLFWWCNPWLLNTDCLHSWFHGQPMLLLLSQNNLKNPRDLSWSLLELAQLLPVFIFLNFDSYLTFLILFPCIYRINHSNLLLVLENIIPESMAQLSHLLYLSVFALLFIAAKILIESKYKSWQIVVRLLDWVH